MKKLAIFVEGLTEQLFISKLFIELTGGKNIKIECQKARKTPRGNRSFQVIDATSTDTGQKYYVLIRDCGGESTVKSDIVDSCADLTRSNYEKILGLRDVSPSFTHADIPKLERLLTYMVPTRFIPIRILLAVMECEAWFLAETTHYEKIDSSITLDKVRDLLSFDPSCNNVEARMHPADDLNRIYHLAGKAYIKDRKRISRTVEVLDYGLIYLDLRNRIPRLDELIREIDVFLQ
ncbi:MAG: hypothetical protein A2X87_08060 [Deltaproteobacteria bacterium GWC2_42_51]|nr:MAG: hypothetical protein A2056_02930 [Deltaproteobacteria bacterium GWA2_42_85]OGP28096.1 MAG: hypothetical protein A2067_08635 [Deltaproteobacteria bacterium GWB2_42_7]OGP36737.1 MAG: hypothetical protein A2X87_08060 [Deltaproteobacteria bacterium GWC2_42_51]OGP38613.1 MAG: hypothetical protein A2090_03340 [Deltaproteobacteria bacterium GWD2_42_10]OGP48761.1 MAG: hypothetical protein A2022_00200 [Deltaproteobacteria bacterium GWF2_42_12]OGQ27035.1 MAG: hypothetical protein A3D29_07950 [De